MKNLNNRWRSLAGRATRDEGTRQHGTAGERDDPATYEDVDLVIVCESTYPYLKGGLSAVVHQICQGSPHLRIGIIHITWDAASPATPLYDLPSSIAWVMPIYQSMAEHQHDFQSYSVDDLRMTGRQQQALVDRFFAAVHAHVEGDDEPLWALYDEGINPRTRSFHLWPMLSTKAFMTRAVEEFGASDVPLTDLFWSLRDFASLAYAVVSPAFPRAAVYHAHTTGAAALLAAAAAHQHSTSFLLTEHNLYTRDTINHLLDRSMENTVAANDWRDLTTYETLGGTTREVTSRDRHWMQWFTRIGAIAYRAADRITYLYPEAIDEAADLCGEPDKSVVVPNGLEPLPFVAARARHMSLAADRRRTDHLWRLAFVARVVPIKGLLDLLDSLHGLRERGVDNFVLDVMGPDGEQPRYVERCRQRVAELGLSDHVRFRGSVNLVEELGEFDMLVMPSHNEGVPIAILEVMAVGLPVIATDVGGIREVVTGNLLDADGEMLSPCGIVIPARDREAMTTSIERIIRDPDLYAQFSQNSTIRLDRIYHINVTLGQYHTIFAEFRIGGEPHATALAPALAEVIVSDRADDHEPATHASTTAPGTGADKSTPGTPVAGHEARRAVISGAHRSAADRRRRRAGTRAPLTHGRRGDRRARPVR